MSKSNGNIELSSSERYAISLALRFFLDESPVTGSEPLTDEGYKSLCDKFPLHEQGRGQNPYD